MVWRLAVIALISTGMPIVGASAQSVLELGGRRELFVDDYLISQRSGLTLRLHEPTRREVVMIRDAPWEGSGSDFETVIRDGDVIRMYYMGATLTTENGTKLPKPIVVRACYAESKDGILWVRPDLGLFDYEGSKQNNILWMEKGLDNFTPFKDANPDCPPDERYKALSGHMNKLFALKSADGIHWTRLKEEPIISKGAFDTMNNAFWDPLRKKYFCYSRGYHDKDGKDFTDAVKGTRDIRVSTSPDFRTWSEPRLVNFVNSPDEGLYTNQVQPYYRAPHVFLGFPMRYVDRIAQKASLMALPDPVHRQRRMAFSPRYGSVLTDLQFMTSRDGMTFHRWSEALIRPGPERDNNWVYGDALKGLGLLETPSDDPTAAPELSFYVTEGHWKDASPLRRYTVRVDGFVSLQAKQAPGEFVSKPLRFSGGKLSLNFATSAAGSIRTELQDVKGQPLPGYSLEECDELFGDTLDRAVSWGGRSEIKTPTAGQPIRLRMVLSDADLYSLQFVP
jgi:hypothetical protein